MTLTPALALNRFGYGPRAADAAPADPARALADQLHRYDPRPPQLRDAADSAAMGVQVVALYDSIRFAGPEKQAAMDARKAATAIERAAYQDAVRRRAALAIATPDPFAERLVHFWANHFAVSIDKQTVARPGGPDGVRGHPPAHNGPVHRHAAGGRAASGDAALSRPGGIDRPGQRHRPEGRGAPERQAPGRPEREPRP